MDPGSGLAGAVFTVAMHWLDEGAGLEASRLYEKAARCEFRL